MEIRTIQHFLHYLGNVRQRTMRVARCIPPDKMDWTYAPGKFTLGDLLRHLAVVERYMWAETVQGHPSRYTTHGKELADGCDNILAFVVAHRRSALASHAGFGTAVAVATTAAGKLSCPINLTAA